MQAGFPGFQGLGLKPSAESRAVMEEPYIYHFPDGNASLARLLVRQLIPGAAPGTTMSDIVTAQFDYARLDQERVGDTPAAVEHGGGDQELPEPR